MKTAISALLIIVIFPFFAKGQRQSHPRMEEKRFEPNVLSFFSENGEPFFVVINGLRQNINPQSVLRIEGVIDAVCDIQILFADNTIREIQKRITVSNPIDEEPVNLIIKIWRNQEGWGKLKLFNCKPKEFNYIPVQNEYVMRYGQDIYANTGNYNNNGYVNNNMNQQVVPPPPPPPPAPMAMDNATFQAAKQTILGSAFEDTRLSTAKTIASNNLFTIDQVIEICKLFSFDDTKLDFAKYIYSKTVDNKNYFRVSSVFTFDDRKNALNDFIQNH